MLYHLNSFLKKAALPAFSFLFVCLSIFSTSLNASPLYATSIEGDSVPAHLRLPCYRAFEKAVIKSALTTAATATGIETGIVDFIGSVASLNRQYYICLDKHYPLHKK